MTIAAAAISGVDHLLESLADQLCGARRGEHRHRGEHRRRGDPAASPRPCWINDKSADEAVKVLVTATQRFSESRNLQDSLGEAIALKGDKAGAQAAYSKALSLATDPMQKQPIEGAIAKLK